jgi:hypothetical protein
VRAEGYYWVKYKSDEVTDSNDFWNIRYFSDGLWQVPYYDFIKEDSFFEEIDERKIERTAECEHDYRSNDGYSVCIKCLDRVYDE